MKISISTEETSTSAAYDKHENAERGVIYLTHRYTKLLTKFGVKEVCNETNEDIYLSERDFNFGIRYILPHQGFGPKKA